MISRDEAYKRMDEVGCYESLTVINEIYDSIGTCKTCIHYDTSLGATPQDGHCKKLRDSAEALWISIEVDENWYCAEYKGNTDD
jgi:hypothetical protein